MKDNEKNCINIQFNKLIDNETIKIIKAFLSKDFSLNTKKAFISDFRHFFQWFKEANQEKFEFVKLLEGDLIDYREYCKSINHSVNTINRRLISLRVLNEYAIKKGIISENPVAEIKLLNIQSPEPKGLSKNQLNRLKRAAKKRGKIRDRVIIEMLSEAGFRVSELANLKNRDIEIRPKSGFAMVRHGKRDKTRKVPLNDRIRPLLKEYLDIEHPDKKIFQGQRGPLTTIAFNKIIDIYAKRTNVKCTPHTLRHTFAFNFLEKNKGDIVVLAQILGHGNINTTAIYTQNRPEDLLRKVEGGE